MKILTAAPFESIIQIDLKVKESLNKCYDVFTTSFQG